MLITLPFCCKLLQPEWERTGAWPAPLRSVAISSNHYRGHWGGESDACISSATPPARTAPSGRWEGRRGVICCFLHQHSQIRLLLSHFCCTTNPPALHSQIHICMLVLDLKDCKQARGNKVWHKNRTAAPVCYGEKKKKKKKELLLGASDKLHIFARAFKVVLWSWTGFLMRTPKLEGELKRKEFPDLNLRSFNIIMTFRGLVIMILLDHLPWVTEGLKGSCQLHRIQL